MFLSRNLEWDRKDLLLVIEGLFVFKDTSPYRPPPPPPPPPPFLIPCLCGISGKMSITLHTYLALRSLQNFYYFTVTVYHGYVQDCFPILKNTNCMSSVMWKLLLILQNELLCHLFSSSNGNWLASIFYYVCHMAIIKV